MELSLDSQSRKVQLRLQKCSPMKLDWDDLRYFLAVIDHGSTKRAAAALKVDQTTCARRVASLEASLGLELFTRDQGRYRPTQDALDLAEAAKGMGAAAASISELANGKRRSRSSKLRITGEEAMAAAFIFPAVARFTRLHPDVDVEVDVSSDKRDLVVGEADIAVRGGLPPDATGLIRRKIGDDPFGFYCSWSYPSPPETGEELRDHPLASFDVLRGRLEERGLGANVRHVTNSATALRRIIEEGSVIGLLPRSVGEASPPLRLCFPVPADVSIWLVYPERLRRLPHVKVLGQFLADEFRTARREGRVG
jgi:DNA-binding transcriptional LysR family regulator